MSNSVLSRLLGPFLLLVVWIALWGDVSWGNVISGLIVIPIVTLISVRLPRSHRVHPWGVAKFAVLFLKMLIDSTIVVARTSLRPTPDRLRAGVVAIHLEHPTALVATVVADAITLTPGTLTLDISPDSSTLYVHVLGIGDPEEVRADVADLERLVVGAIEPIETGPIESAPTEAAPIETAPIETRETGPTP
ncbi:MAG: Na+/H+ antiporter subunit E [Acidimicrobiales bacterium]